MKAIVVHEFGAPSVMRFEEVATPRPGPGEVLLAVAAVSINRTLDCVARAGRYARPIALPFTPGVDPSGVVVEVGAGVSDRREGDRVTAKLPVGGELAAGGAQHLGGGYAEYVCTQAHRTTIVPDGVDFAAATVIARHVPLALTLLRDRAGLAPGEWVLVMGAAGGLGSAGVQAARHLGAKVIAAAGSDERVAVGLGLGADAGVNYREAGWGAQVARITGGAGVDVVFENIGEPALFGEAFAALGRHGRLVTVGSHGGGVVPLDLTRLYHRALTVTGSTAVDPGDIALSLAAAAQGRFTARIDKVMPLSQAVRGHELVEAREGPRKIVLDPTAA